MQDGTDKARLARKLAAPVAGLMLQRPPSWGLRGDALLWDSMVMDLQAAPLPAGELGLESLVAGSFERLTGRSLLQTTEPFHVERFARGGMSSGQVDPRWWREVAIPLLCDRLYEHRRAVGAFADALQAEFARKKRQLSQDAVASLINDAATLLANLAARERHMSAVQPQGEPDRIDTARQAVVRLAKALERLTPESR